MNITHAMSRTIILHQLTYLFCCNEKIFKIEFSGNLLSKFVLLCDGLQGADACRWCRRSLQLQFCHWKYFVSFTKAQNCRQTNPFTSCSFVSPNSSVTLILTKSLCDCPLFELFSEREMSSLGNGSSSGFGLSEVGGPVIEKRRH